MKRSKPIDPTASTEGGFSLLWALIAVALVAVAVLGVIAVLPSVMQLSQGARENQRAATAIRSELDARRAMPFPTDADASFLAGPLTFTVNNLREPAPETPHGTIEFLTEAEAQTMLGGRDIDLDLDLNVNETEAAHAGFEMFPVRLTVRWNDRGNVRTVSTLSYLYNHTR